MPAPTVLEALNEALGELGLPDEATLLAAVNALSAAIGGGGGPTLDGDNEWTDANTFQIGVVMEDTLEVDGGIVGAHSAAPQFPNGIRSAGNLNFTGTGAILLVSAGNVTWKVVVADDGTLSTVAP